MIPRMATVNPPAPERNSFGIAILVSLVLLIAWQLAYWTWNFLAPPSASAPAAVRADAVDLAVAARLFGSHVASTSGIASSPGLRLKGVVAPTPGVAASAIFSAGTGKDIAVFLGSDVRPGVTLVEVHPEYAVVSRGGVHERIDLEARRSIASSATPGAARAGGFRLNVSRSGATSFNFSRKELDEALRDPNQLNYLGQIGVPPGGGVRMDAAPPGSLAQKLGLQPGDIIRKLNGQAVASPGDLARLYQQFGTLSAIQAEVQRAGMTVQLSYAIQP